MKTSELNIFDYVSAQPGTAGLDEVQQLFLCYATGCHTALSGPPGVGKTTLVTAFAKAVGQPLVSRVMGPKVNESMLISYPDLVSKDGSTVTVTRPGLLARALKQNAIYFADEIDRLTEDNQKLHNSAFDNRRSVTLRNGQVVTGGENFYGIIAYNPTQGLKNDLEDALADRFTHINFDYFPPEVESLISLRKAQIPHQDLTGNKTGLRAVLFSSRGGRKLRFLDVADKGGQAKFTDFFTKAPVALKPQAAKGLTVYSAYLPNGNGDDLITPSDLSLEDLSLRLSEFCSDLRSLATDGARSLDQGILAKFHDAGQGASFANIRLHLPSSRIIQAALKQAAYLHGQMGCPMGRAQYLAAHLVANQAGYGKFGRLRVGRSTNRDLLLTLAGAKGLLPLARQRALKD